MHIFAYIEPGLGALIWQSTIGIFVGLVFYMRRTRKWIGSLMGRMVRTEQKAKESEVDLQMSKSKVGADNP